MGPREFLSANVLMDCFRGNEICYTRALLIPLWSNRVVIFSAVFRVSCSGFRVSGSRYRHLLARAVPGCGAQFHPDEYFWEIRFWCILRLRKCANWPFIAITSHLLDLRYTKIVFLRNTRRDEIRRNLLHGCLNYPLGGVRPFHQKSTCLKQLTVGPYVKQIWARYGGNPPPPTLSYCTDWY